MKCAACSNELTAIKSKNASAYACSACHGLWINSNELANFLKSLTEKEDVSPETPHLFQRRERASGSPGETLKSCPQCARTLNQFNYAYDSNIFLDKCDSCAGLWLDSGEALSLARFLKEDSRISAIANTYFMEKRNQLMDDLADLGKIMSTRTRYYQSFGSQFFRALIETGRPGRVFLLFLLLLALIVMFFKLPFWLNIKTS